MIFDDATSEVYDVQLVDEESTVTVMAALKRVVEATGLFCSLYSDRGSHMAWTPKAGGPVDRQQSDADRTSAGATGHRTDPGLFAPGAGPLRAAVWHLARAAASGIPAAQHHHRGSGQ